MSETTPTAQQADLGYRGWQQTLRPTAMAWWPIARTSLFLILRRKLFWLLLASGMINFLFMFAMIYLYTSFVATSPQFARFAEQVLRGVSASGETYSRFIFQQGIVCVLMLAFGGAVLVGSDHRRGGVIFYLSRRLGSWHYLFGKFIGIAALVSLVTTVPALILYLQYGMMTEFQYFADTWNTILLGILGYGTTVAVTLSLLCLALGSWLHRTVPLVLSWGTLFVLLPVVAEGLRVIFRGHSPQSGAGRDWLLLIIWRDLHLVGERCFGSLSSRRAEHFWPALFILLTIVGLSIFLSFWKLRKIRVVS